MSREVVAILYCHNSLISLVGLDCQRKLLMRTDVKRREIWEWSDHTPLAASYLDRTKQSSPPENLSRYVRLPEATPYAYRRQVT